MEGQLVSGAQDLAKTTFDSSFNYMNLGFTLASALAWTGFAQQMVKQYVKVNGNGSGMRMALYPVMVTLMAVVVFKVSKQLNANTKRPVVVPVVSA